MEIFETRPKGGYLKYPGGPLSLRGHTRIFREVKAFSLSLGGGGAQNRPGNNSTPTVHLIC